MSVPVITLLFLAVIYAGRDSVMFRYQLPTHYAVGADCRSLSDSAMTTLSRLEFWGVARHERTPRLLRLIDVKGRRGESDSVWLELPGIWSVYSLTYSDLGGESCPSPVLVVHADVSVPNGKTGPQAEAWFDLQGRKIAKPTTPGVYVHRMVGRAEKVVVLR